MTDIFDLDALAAQIRREGLSLGEPLTWLEQTASTNADAVAAAKQGVGHGALFLSDRQTAGRGRMGRCWLSPAGENLMFSLVLRPTMPAARLSSITLAIGLGIADAAADFVDTERVGIKWPNDVYVGRKKVAGILVEGALLGDACEYVVVGIGLNVLQRKFDASIADRATSLALETTRVLSRSDVLVRSLAGVAERLRVFETDGLGPMMDDLRGRDVTKGRTVRLGDEQGVADGIESDGRLRVLVGGQGQLVHAGDVEIVG